MLKKLQSVLKKVWNLSEYSAAFRRDKTPYRDFRHTIAHLFKAVNKLNEMVECADHRGDLEAFDSGQIAKYLADVIISAARAGLVAPKGEINVELAVYTRMQEKMDVRMNDDALKYADALAQAVVECFGWKGEFRNRFAPCSTKELRASAEFVVKLMKKELKPV